MLASEKSVVAVGGRLLEESGKPVVGVRSLCDMRSLGSAVRDLAVSRTLVFETSCSILQHGEVAEARRVHPFWQFTIMHN